MSRCALAGLLALAGVIVGISLGAAAISYESMPGAGMFCGRRRGFAAGVCDAGLVAAPQWAGLVAGVAAGAFGIFAVSLHCPDNGIVRIGIWRSAAVLVMAGLGRVPVPRLIHG